MGVLLAFGIDRHYEGRLNNTRTKEFLELIREELEQNTRTLNGIYSAMVNVEDLGIPYYRLRNYAWLSMSNRIALIRNAKLRQNIITCYYKFDLHERGIERYADLVYAIDKQSPNPSDKLKTTTQRLRESIAGQLDPQRKEGSLLVFGPLVVQEINEEIRKLTDC